MDPGKIIAILKNLPLFDKLEKKQILQIFKIMSPQNYKAGSQVFREGDDSREFFIFLRGNLELFIKGASIGSFTKPMPLGELGVFLSEKRSATVTVLEDSFFLKIPFANLVELLKKDLNLFIQISYNVAHIVSQKVKNNNKMLSQIIDENESLHKQIDLLNVQDSVIKKPDELKEKENKIKLYALEENQHYLTIFGFNGSFYLEKISRSTFQTNRKGIESLKLMQKVEGFLFVKEQKPEKLKIVVKGINKENIQFTIREKSKSLEALYKEVSQ